MWPAVVARRLLRGCQRQRRGGHRLGSRWPGPGRRATGGSGLVPRRRLDARRLHRSLRSCHGAVVELRHRHERAGVCPAAAAERGPDRGGCLQHRRWCPGGEYRAVERHQLGPDRRRTANGLVAVRRAVAGAAAERRPSSPAATSGSTTGAMSIARWDGSSWSPLGGRHHGQQQLDGVLAAGARQRRSGGGRRVRHRGRLSRSPTSRDGTAWPGPRSASASMRACRR